MFLESVMSFTLTWTECLEFTTFWGEFTTWKTLKFTERTLKHFNCSILKQAMFFLL